MTHLPKIILSLLILCGAVLVFFINGNNVSQNPIALPTAKNLEKSTQLQEPLPPLNELLSYSAPEAWVVENAGATIKTPDYKVEEIAPSQGIAIYLSYERTQSGIGIESYKKDWENTAGVSQVSTYQIDGMPALKFLKDFEGVRGHIYQVIKGDYRFLISIYAPSLFEEAKYQKEIDSFIESIKFK